MCLCLSRAEGPRLQQFAYVFAGQPMRPSRENEVAVPLMAFTSALLLRQSLLPSQSLLPLDIIQTIAPWARDTPEPLQNPLVFQEHLCGYSTGTR